MAFLNCMRPIAKTVLVIVMGIERMKNKQGKLGGQPNRDGAMFLQASLHGGHSEHYTKIYLYAVFPIVACLSFCLFPGKGTRTGGPQDRETRGRGTEERGTRDRRTRKGPPHLGTKNDPPHLGKKIRVPPHLGGKKQRNTTGPSSPATTRERKAGHTQEHKKDPCPTEENKKAKTPDTRRHILNHQCYYTHKPQLSSPSSCQG